MICVRLFSFSERQLGVLFEQQISLIVEGSRRWIVTITGCSAIGTIFPFKYGNEFVDSGRATLYILRVDAAVAFCAVASLLSGACSGAVEDRDSPRFRRPSTVECELKLPWLEAFPTSAGLYFFSFRLIAATASSILRPCRRWGSAWSAVSAALICGISPIMAVKIAWLTSSGLHSPQFVLASTISSLQGPHRQLNNAVVWTFARCPIRRTMSIAWLSLKVVLSIRSRECI